MVGGEQIKERAEMIAIELKITDCKFSDGWFSRFKARHNLKFKTSHGEAKSADLDAADKWVEEEWPKLRARYDLSSIYSGDETGLNFHDIMT